MYLSDVFRIVIKRIVKFLKWKNTVSGIMNLSIQEPETLHVDLHALHNHMAHLVCDVD